VEEQAEIRTWRPNRAKPESRRMKSWVVLILLVSAVLILIVTIGGWERLEGGGPVAVTWAIIYIFFAFLVARWNRGVLPVAASLAIIFTIFAAVAAPAWFSRDKVGLDDPMLNPSLLGTLTLLIIPAQLLTIVVSMAAFRQEWHVEEELPSGGAPNAPGSGGPARPPEPQPSSA
jgi:hypothetical protein